MKANQKLKLSDDSAAVGGLAMAIIVGFIALVIGLNLIPELAFQASEAQQNASVTGFADSLLGLLPGIVVAGLLIAAVAIFFVRDS